MAAKRNGLGKGLDALFAVNNNLASASAQTSVSLLQIDPNPNQPRKDFDPEKLSELSDSIRNHGLLQPLIVVPRGDRFLLVAGERRWRAARQAGLTQVPVTILSLDDQEISEISLIENLQRDDLNPIEEAKGIAQLIESYSLTQEDAAERLGKSRSAIANALRLLQLPETVRQHVIDGTLSAGHARALLSLASEQEQKAVAAQIISENLSVRQTEELLRKPHSKAKKKGISEQTDDSIFEDLESRLMQALGTKAMVHGTINKGRIILEYYQRDDLERIYEIMTQILSETGHAL